MIVLAFLPQLNFLDFTMIDVTEVSTAKEQYQDDLMELEEKERMVRSFFFFLSFLKFWNFEFSHNNINIYIPFPSFFYSFSFLFSEWCDLIQRCTKSRSNPITSTSLYWSNWNVVWVNVHGGSGNGQTVTLARNSTGMGLSFNLEWLRFVLIYWRLSVLFFPLSLSLSLSPHHSSRMITQRNWQR